MCQGPLWRGGSLGLAGSLASWLKSGNSSAVRENYLMLDTPELVRGSRFISRQRLTRAKEVCRVRVPRMPNRKSDMG
jgi:hypothetical protein